VELLVLVVESPGIAVSAAADALALAPNTLSTLVSVLLRAGLIERGRRSRPPCCGAASVAVAPPQRLSAALVGERG
jgi:hypothetical protein